MTLKEELIKALIEAKIPSPRLEADIIIKNAAPDYPKTNEIEEKNALLMLKRRLNHEPLDKIIGKKEFYKSTFKVNSNVLSPRPDTEILVESALELIPNLSSGTILDLGTGSGCILLSLLKERPNLKGIGVDISPKALEIASENAINLQLENRVNFINKSWTELNLRADTFDLITSNPPYIPKKEIETLDKEVKNYDPLIALDGGDDGLNCYREIAEIAPLILKTNGYILLEVGYNQADLVADIFKNKGFNLVKYVADLASINRCVILKK